MHKQLLTLLTACILTSNVFATNPPDEGMWLPSLIGKNEAQMKKQGFKLTAKDIYDINKASLKDAIVMLGGGFCTGEIVSNKGLIFTNHHCGYDAITKVRFSQPGNPTVSIQLAKTIGQIALPKLRRLRTTAFLSSPDQQLSPPQPNP